MFLSLSIIHKITNLQAKKQMDRIFHARTTGKQILLLIILGLGSFLFLWYKLIIPALITVIALVILIEQIIHTTYTITTDKKLVVSHGRFCKKHTVMLDDIHVIQQKSILHTDFYSIGRFLCIEYGNNQSLSIAPSDEKSFMEVLTKRKHS